MNIIRTMRIYLRRGFTLVEVLVAMLVLAIGLLGLAGITVVVLRSNLLSQQISDATTIATDLMEALKRQSLSALTAAQCASGDLLTSSAGGSSSCGIIRDSGLLSVFTDFGPPLENQSCGIVGILKAPSDDVATPATTPSTFDTTFATLQGGSRFAKAGGFCSLSTQTLAQREYIRMYRITAATDGVDLAVVVLWKDKFGKWRNIRLSTTKTQ